MSFFILSMICGIIIMRINHHFSYQDKAAVKKYILFWLFYSVFLGFFFLNFQDFLQWFINNKKDLEKDHNSCVWLVTGVTDLPYC